MGVVVRQHKRFPGVGSQPARVIEFSPVSGSVVYVQADGELIGVLPARVEICENVLTLLTPPLLADRESRYLSANDANLAALASETRETKAHG
jgi:hypothetical protein